MNKGYVIKSFSEGYFTGQTFSPFITDALILRNLEDIKAILEDIYAYGGSFIVEIEIKELGEKINEGVCR